MRTTMVLTAAILALVAAGGIIYTAQRGAGELPLIVAAGNPQLGNVATSSDPYDIEVRFDGEQFEPKEITVEKGTRVRFVNDSDIEVWPASAIHPTHTLYPEKAAGDCLGSSFDSCDTLERGEFFAFTFDYPGEWRYHDHIRAYKTGVIFVKE